MANFQKIKVLAKQKGLSLSYIAEQIGMTPTGLGLVMKSNKTMTDKIEKIAQLLDVKVGVFFDEEPDDSVRDVDVVAYYKSIIEQKDRIIEQKDKVIEILSNRR